MEGKGLRIVGGFAPSDDARAVEIITMSDTQVAALVMPTVQQTNIWVKTLGEELHVEDRHAAYMALRAVLHVLRDRLTAEQAVHLGAQLPLYPGPLLRGDAWPKNPPANGSLTSSRPWWRPRCRRSSRATLCG